MTEVALLGAAGFAAGLLAGVVVGGLLGDLTVARVRRAVGGGTEDSEAVLEPDELERAVRAALRADTATRRLPLSVHAVDGRIIELTGTAPDETARRQAGATAAAAAGGAAVVNRVLVTGVDVRGPASASEAS